MKKDKFLAILSIILGFSIFFLCLYISSIKEKKPFVDLPEEYMGISKDSLYPDTILSYYSGDTIYLYFKH